MKILRTDSYNSPLGEIVLAVDGGELCYADFAGNDARMQKLLRAHYQNFTLRAANLPEWRARMRRYFGGDFGAFDGVQLRLGGTEFQRRVWRALQNIPPGKSISYRELAARIGKPKAARAVGSANARNPVAIVIPCHRVIRADGGIGGYAGDSGNAGETSRKTLLLAHESAPGFLHARRAHGTEERT